MRRAAVDLTGRLTPDAGHDRSGHGTHTAGVAATIAPGAVVVSCRAIEGGAVHARLLTALDWMLDQDVHVLLLAFGTSPGLRLFDRALQVLTDRDVLVVTAAGNGGPGTLLSPASAPDTLSVGAADADGRPIARSGSTGDPLGATCYGPDLLAPGVDVNGPEPGGVLGARTGTSQAAAVVAGAAALVRARRPELDARQVRALLCTTATPPPFEERHRSRFGSLDLRAALDADGPTPATPRPDPTLRPPPEEGDALLARILRGFGPYDVVLQHTGRDAGAPEAGVARLAAVSAPPRRARHLPRLGVSAVTASAAFVRAAVQDPHILVTAPASAG